VGGAIGVAVIGVIFFGQLSSAAPRSFSTVESNLRRTLTAQHVPAAAQESTVAMARNCYIDRTREKDASATPKSCVIPAGPSAATSVSATPPNYQINVGALYNATKQANATNFDSAFHWSILYAIGLLVVTFALSFVLPRRFRAEAYTEAV
jgi:hypothetical protein